MTDNTLKHEQQYEELDSLSDWALDNESQDIRNRTLVTPAGEKIGVVQDLLVDRGQERGNRHSSGRWTLLRCRTSRDRG